MALWSCGDEEGEDGESKDADQAAAQTDSTAADSTLADSVAADTLAKTIEAVPVEVALAHTGEISSYLLFNSTIETEAAVEIFPQISGMVERVAVEEGDRVEFGDTLVAIEDDQLRIANREAQVNLDYQQTGYKRTEEMFRRKLISDQEFETRKYELEQARLRVERTQLDLAHAAILAPFSGVITERYVQVGARVGSGSKLYDLIKLDDMIARVFVPGQYLSAINNGQQSVITSEFLPDKSFKGWVKRISPVVDPRSGTFKVTVGVRDRFEYLRPGLFVSVRIVTDTHEKAILIPKQAIVYDGGDKFIFAVDDTVAVRVKLQPGFEDVEYVEALADVEAGSSIIIVGQNGLKDGTRVRVVNDNQALESEASAEVAANDEG
jgi:membrane fusion protein (multidrug efflux system)